MTVPTFHKDTTERLDYTMDWGSWLQSGEIITGTPVWTIPTGLTKDAEANDTTKATVWLTGGVSGTKYTIQCRITTNQSRVAERAMVIQAFDRR